MRVENFKGIHELSVDLDGNKIISGKNGSGKTSVYDAYLWCLFGKDSSGRASFEIIRHGAERAVVEVESGGRIFRREYLKSYVKKRGRADAEFKGFKTEFYLDEVPVRKKDYEDAISGIFGSEEKFRLISDVNYFGSLKTAERRKVLSDITDMDVRPEEPEELGIGDKTPEDYLKMLKAQLKRLNDDLKSLPARIDEASKNIIPGAEQKVRELNAKILAAEERVKSETDALNSGWWEKEKARLNFAVVEAQAEMMEQKNGIQKEIDKAEAEVRKEERKAASLADREIQNLQDHITGEAREVSDKENQKRISNGIIESNTNEISRKERAVQEFREKYIRISERELTSECYACGQALPDDKIKEAKEAQDSELRNIQKEGRRMNEDIAVMKEESAAENKKVEKLTAEIMACGERQRKLKNDIEDVEAKKAAMVENAASEQKADVKRLKKKLDGMACIERYESAVKELEEHKNSERSKPDTTKLEAAKSEIRELQELRAEYSASQRAEDRVKELEAEKVSMQERHDSVSYQIQLTEDWVRDIARAVEEAVNGLFSRVKFQLFEEQINGGLKDTCLIMWDGVSYDTNLNTGARINAGLDIVNTLQEIYGTAPLFIDNFEAVTELEIQPDSPLILLEQRREQKELEIAER